MAFIRRMSTDDQLKGVDAVVKLTLADPQFNLKLDALARVVCWEPPEIEISFDNACALVYGPLIIEEHET